MLSLITLALALQTSCLGPAVAAADAFDMDGAIKAARAAATSCDDAAIAVEYLAGLAAAKRAYASGGSSESLEPVNAEIAALERLAAGLPGGAHIAALVLHAASAAAQSERDEMALYLDEAIRLESLQLAAGQPPAPVISAHEAAGDLWLEVHRFDDARQAYDVAAARVGTNPRIALGRARAAARQNAPSACAEYRHLLEQSVPRLAGRPEIVEARDYLARPICAQANGGP